MLSDFAVKTIIHRKQITYLESLKVVRAEVVRYRTLESMKKLFSFCLLLGCSIAFAQGSDPLKLVDPLIGTGPEGHTFPGAAAPFGMVQLSPDTQIRLFKQSYKWAAGYRYEDTSILGFSHTHFSGAGHSDLGDVLLTPVSGENVPFEAGDVEGKQRGYRSRFSHTSESAEPGIFVGCEKVVLIKKDSHRRIGDAKSLADKCPVR